MLNAYLGIAHRYGLQCLLPEEDGVLPSLLRRGFAQPGCRPFCLWAVLDVELARGIACQVAAGENLDALCGLQACAREIGIIPLHEDDVFCSATI